MSIKQVIKRCLPKKRQHAPEYGSAEWLEMLPPGYAKSEFPVEYHNMREERISKFPLMPQ